MPEGGCVTGGGTCAKRGGAGRGALHAAVMDGGDAVEVTKALTFAPADVLALEAAHYDRLAAWAPARAPLKSVSLFLSDAEPMPDTAQKWAQTFGRTITAQDA